MMKGIHLLLFVFDGAWRETRTTPKNKTALPMMLAKTTSLSIGDEKEKLTLLGRSRAGDATCFAIPEWKWLFDCGARIQGWLPATVFLSHTHNDHVQYLAQMKNPEKAPVVYLPALAEPLVQRYLAAQHDMIECLSESAASTSESALDDIKLVPLVPDQSFEFRNKAESFLVRTIDCDHRIDCIGFSIFRRKNRLKNEYKGLPGHEISKLRKQGVGVMTQCEIPVLCYLGDTTHLVFEKHPEILTQHSIIIVECTFIDKESLGRADKTKHMHWNRLKQYVEANPTTLFVLIHFSLRHGNLMLREFFREHSKFKNIHPMLLEEEIAAEWEKKVSDSSRPPGCNCFRCTGTVQ